MKNKLTTFITLFTALIVCQLTILPATQFANANEDIVAQGKEIAFDRKKGNCLACHVIADGSLPGTSGPPLVAMKQRFPETETLKAQIFNPLTRNPNSLMPPFGLHNILSEEDIDKIVAYLYTL